MDKQNVSTYNGILFHLKKAILAHVITWVNFEGIMLSLKSQSQNDKYYMILPIQEALREGSMV